MANFVVAQVFQFVIADYLQKTAVKNTGQLFTQMRRRRKLSGSCITISFMTQAHAIRKLVCIWMMEKSLIVPQCSKKTSKLEN